MAGAVRAVAGRGTSGGGVQEGATLGERATRNEGSWTTTVCMRTKEDKFTGDDAG